MMMQFRKCVLRSQVLFAACVAAVLLVCGCGKSTPPDTRAADEAALRDADAQWAKTAASEDVDATIAFYSDDAIVLPPNARATTDKQRFAPFGPSYSRRAHFSRGRPRRSKSPAPTIWVTSPACIKPLAKMPRASRFQIKASFWKSGRSS